MSETEETLLEFPCLFPIKAIGKAEVGIEAIVVDILRRHVPELAEEAVSLRPHPNGKWLAVTVTIEAQSKPQLDAIYRDLTAHEHVVWAM